MNIKQATIADIVAELNSRNLLYVVTVIDPERSEAISEHSDHRIDEVIKLAESTCHFLYEEEEKLEKLAVQVEQEEKSFRDLGRG